MADILAVDDDASVRTVLEVVLKGEGHRVRAFANGPSALHSATAQIPDLVVLDLRMPGMDGEEALQELKKLDPALPIFFLTAAGDFPDQPVLRLADCCFVKSSNLGPMIAAIEHACGRSDREAGCWSSPKLAEMGTCLRPMVHAF